MAFKVFLDANVLLDLTLKRDNYIPAKQVVELVLDRKITAFITPSIVQILGHYLTKYYGSEKAKELILTLLINISIIDISHEITLVALHSKINDIEDALQYYSAISHKMNYFISRDKQLNKSSIPILPVYSPEDFIKEFV